MIRRFAILFQPPVFPPTPAGVAWNRFKAGLRGGHCPHCGRPLDRFEGLEHCYHCGKQLGPDAFGGIETAGSLRGFLLRLGVLATLALGLTAFFAFRFSL